MAKERRVGNDWGAWKRKGANERAQIGRDLRGGKQIKKTTLGGKGGKHGKNKIIQTIWRSFTVLGDRGKRKRNAK